MSFAEMREAMRPMLDQTSAHVEKREVVVAIGHSKDLVDFETIRRFLVFLREQSVAVTTFSRLLCQSSQLSA